MTTSEFKERIENFHARLRLIQEDFERLNYDFEAYEDEQKCAFCCQAKEDVGGKQKCPACDAPFCEHCWKDYIEKKFKKGEATT